MRNTALFVLFTCTLSACRSSSVHEGDQAPAKPTPVAAVPTVPAREVVPAVPVIPDKPTLGGFNVVSYTKTNSPPPSDAAPVGTVGTATRAERFKALTAEHEKVMDEYYDLFRNAKTPEEEMEISKAAKKPDTAPFIARANALVDEDPKDETAVKAIGWLFQNSRGEGESARLCALVEKHHADSSEVASLLGHLGSAGDQGVRLIEQMSEKSPHETVRGRALYQRATLAMNDRRFANELRAMPAGADKTDYAEYLGPEKFQRLLQLDPAQADQAAATLFERVQKEYGAVKLRAGTPNESTLGDEADANLFEIRNLSVGKVAPEIEGEDTSGVPFKLSDYRGKVVMLDFWGFW